VAWVIVFWRFACNDPLVMSQQSLACHLPRIVRLGRPDGDAVLDLLACAFGETVVGPEAAYPVEILPWNRMYGARLADPDRLAGMISTFDLDVPVPGSRVRGAGLTWAAVHPRDRRRGVLTAMIRHHLHEVRERGLEPISLLFASETTIYGRFGYGGAADEVRLSLPHGATLRPLPGGEDLRVRFETADVERHLEVLEACYERVGADRPGCAHLVTPGIRRPAMIRLRDSPARRQQGTEPLRVLTVVDGTEEVQGYALFRRWTQASDLGPAGTVEVTELIARDAPTSRALWTHLLDLDLTVGVVTPRLPVDDPLLYLLLDPRAGSPRTRDNLWCRLVDVPAALAGRRYQAPVDVVFGLTDVLCPWNAGCWRLVGGPDHARCEPSSTPPQVRLDVRELGAVYLGGTSLLALADAGLVAVRNPRAAAALSVALGWQRAPLCPWEI
jgi:predicted acetyltransferase